MKTLRIFLLAFIAILCSFSSWATDYDYDFEVDGIYYKISSLENLEATVVKGEKKYLGDIVLPATVNFKGKELKVCTIGNAAFFECTGLTSIDFQNVQIIEDRAFEGCI